MTGAVIVTGSGRGIGAATAELLAARGHPVCVNYLRDQAAAEAVVARICSKGGRAMAVQADVSIEDDVRRLFDACEEALGRPRGLVNNAGILETQMRFELQTADRWHRVFATNVMGAFLCAREAVRRMSTQHGGAGGAIVNVSSMAAKLGSPHEYVDYAASKGAIDTMTIGLAREVAGDGIRVNAVRAGLIHTGMHAAGGEPGRIDRLKATTPMQRGGQPEEVAETIVWLLSDAASYVTGAFIDVSGGR